MRFWLLGNPVLSTKTAHKKFYTGPESASDGIDSSASERDPGFSHLRNAWGRFCFDSADTEATDWGGSLSVNRGAEIVRRVIRREPAQDYLLSLTDRQSIESVSGTSIYNDGVAVDIVIPRPIPVLESMSTIDSCFECDMLMTTVVNTVYPELDPVKEVLETGLLRSTFSVEEISALDTLTHPDFFSGQNTTDVFFQRGLNAGCPELDDQTLLME